MNFAHQVNGMGNEEWLQWVLVGAPILSLVATWMSLRTYGRLRQKTLKKHVNPSVRIQENPDERSACS